MSKNKLFDRFRLPKIFWISTGLIIYLGYNLSVFKLFLSYIWIWILRIFLIFDILFCIILFIMDQKGENHILISSPRRTWFAFFMGLIGAMIPEWIYKYSSNNFIAFLIAFTISLTTFVFYCTVIMFRHSGE